MARRRFDDDANIISGGILVVVTSFFISIFSFYTYRRVSKTELPCFDTVKAVAARILSILLLCLILFIIYRCIKYYMRRRQREVEQIYELVDKTIELLHSPDTPSVMPVLHIRDTLMSPCERRTSRMSKLWDKCVRFIEEHESRVKVELVNIDGEDFRAWKWVGGSAGNTSFSSRLADVSINKTLSTETMDEIGSKKKTSTVLKTGDIEWQGSAFEEESQQNNQVYDRMKYRTQFLKIRNMFDQKTRMAYPKTWKTNVRDAILEKCINHSKDGYHGITHMVIDETSIEGVVFAKCDSEASARQAYCSLHGWWCEKKLVSVKFLKAERYYQRFPEARLCTTQLKFKS